MIAYHDLVFFLYALWLCPDLLAADMELQSIYVET